MTTYTHRIASSIVSTTDVWAAVEGAKAHDCAQWEIETPHAAYYGRPTPDGVRIAARGTVAQPLRTQAEAAAISNATMDDRTDW